MASAASMESAASVADSLLQTVVRSGGSRQVVAATVSALYRLRCSPGDDVDASGAGERRRSVADADCESGLAVRIQQVARRAHHLLDDKLGRGHNSLALAILAAHKAGVLQPRLLKQLRNLNRAATALRHVTRTALDEIIDDIGQIGLAPLTTEAAQVAQWLDIDSDAEAKRCNEATSSSGGTTAGMAESGSEMAEACAFPAARSIGADAAAGPHAVGGKLAEASEVATEKEAAKAAADKEAAEEAHEPAVRKSTVESEAKLSRHGVLQYHVKLDEKRKTKKLIDLLIAMEFSQVVIFVRTARRAIGLNALLNESLFPAMAVLGRPGESEHKMDNGARIAVTTDAFGRGVEAGHASIVINYDFPEMSDMYLHRVGSCERFAVSFVANEVDEKVLKQVESGSQMAIELLPENDHAFLQAVGRSFAFCGAALKPASC
eukprot:TRINITY_DN15487_c0_g1_i1.p1 TRINITY_DN15487_c0_g1~~TRINITY_DN15487_c0_g1_i1.p1  ORF type:complete len:464 (+),score=106.26 TRINITY_DN15487_c0_g1_i1:89-1393(+)